ncbi:MAG: acyl-CoA dehydrogenase family protein [Actinomycetota bacterium]|nr:acyl-CoA dehydrogenase family protein [Actinomycetota bacterium]
MNRAAGSPPSAGELVERARRIADEVLLPQAGTVDRAGDFPSRQLDEIAAAGLYGILAPATHGGLESDPRTFARVLEELASGCLTTAFVWGQHHNAVRAVAAAEPGLRDAWLPGLASGARRAGVAFAALRRPGPPLLRATLDGDDLVLDGIAPFVTGWSHVDVVHVAARTEEDDVVWSLVDALPAASLDASEVELAALGASSTATVRFSSHRVPRGRVTLVEPLATWRERDRRSLRTNGALALGVASRCARILGSQRLADAVGRGRDALATVRDEDVPRARAEAARLAMRAATELVVARGSRAVAVGDDAPRLVREAMFLLVFGQTDQIRAEQLALAALDD